MQQPPRLRTFRDSRPSRRPEHRRAARARSPCYPSAVTVFSAGAGGERIATDRSTIGVRCVLDVARGMGYHAVRHIRRRHKWIRDSMRIAVEHAAALRSTMTGGRRRRAQLGMQVQTPVVAGHEVALRELELALPEQFEAELATDRVRWRVVKVREGVYEAVLVVALCELDRLRGRRACDAATLELRHDHPADFVDLLVAPLLGPEADRADAGAARPVNDLEHAIAALEALIAALTRTQLVRGLGATEVLGHAWVAHQPREQWQITASPAFKGHRRAHRRAA